MKNNKGVGSNLKKFTCSSLQATGVMALKVVNS